MDLPVPNSPCCQKTAVFCAREWIKTLASYNFAEIFVWQAEHLGDRVQNSK